MAKQTILIAAFEPFGGRRRNRSYEAVARLGGQTIADFPITLARLPVVFASLPSAVLALIERDPAVLLLVGESASARQLAVENIALNVAHAPQGDNAGAYPINQALVEGGALASPVLFDVPAATQSAVDAGVRCEGSWHAGTFCCNAALFHALEAARQRAPLLPVGFVHVPGRWPWANDRKSARGIGAIAAWLARTRRVSPVGKGPHFD